MLDKILYRFLCIKLFNLQITILTLLFYNRNSIITKKLTCKILKEILSSILPPETMIIKLFYGFSNLVMILPLKIMPNNLQNKLPL